MISESDNTQYTVDTLIPISKNFLKKTLIKNDATKKANKELLNICKQALAKQAEKFKIQAEKLKIMDMNKHRELKDELYEKTQKINLLKMLNEKKKENKINFENKVKIEKKIKLNSNAEYIDLEKQHNVIKKIIYEPINKKKELLMLYKDIPNENINLNIDIYNIMMN